MALPEDFSGSMATRSISLNETSAGPSSVTRVAFDHRLSCSDFLYVPLVVFKEEFMNEGISAYTTVSCFLHTVRSRYFFCLFLDLMNFLETGVFVGEMDDWSGKTFFERVFRFCVGRKFFI